ncbi:MAG: hypothetical protein N4A72_12785 [Bacteroidales bacterium]|jgi:hypothetical protein|nr:hypothetical protein [Bacteroidales bacterium]
MSQIIDLSNLHIDDIITLNKISKGTVLKFNNFLDKIYDIVGDDIDWLVSSTLSRNTYLSTLYLDFCYLDFIKYKLSTNNNIKSIIVSRPSIKRCLDDYMSRRKLDISIVCVCEKGYVYNYTVKPLLYYLQNAKFSLSRLFCKSKKRRERVNGDVSIIDTFFVDSTFRNGNYNDRYYPGLIDQLDFENRKKTFFAPTILTKNSVRSIVELSKNADVNFIFNHDYLTLSDYLFAIFRSFRVKKSILTQLSFEGFNVEGILKEDFKKNRNNSSSFIGLLNYRFFKRLKDKGVKLKHVVVWFENQVIHRGYIKGIRESFPEATVFGYQGFIVPFDFSIYTSPTISENKLGLIPDKIKVVGRNLINKIKQFDESLDVGLAPGYRFASIHENAVFNSINHNSVLIALPISYSESCEIVDLVLRTIKEFELYSIKFYFKPHPLLDIDSLKSRFKEQLHSVVEFVGGDYVEWLNKTDLAIGSSSSTCVETISMGKPMIILGSQSGLTQNPIPENVTSDIWKLCYTPFELQDAIKEYISLSSERKKELTIIGSEIKKCFFEKPENRHLTHELLNI